jgi:phage terminase large subunit-like protein
MNGIPESIIRHAARLAAEIEQATSRRQLENTYLAGTAEQGVRGGPYKWQVEFHNAGSDNFARAILAGNRVGKSRSAAAEVAIHATGLYPKWWTGRRFTEPIDAIVANETNEMLRDINQEQLVGKIVVDDNENKSVSGTGWIPQRLLVTTTFRQCGVPNVMDTITVKHASGGHSVISLKSYEQGYEKFQGVSRHLIWIDEEPVDDMIFSESMMRLIDKKGILIFTRTPLFGSTKAVQRFLTAKPGAGFWYKNVTWDDAPHLDKEARDQILAGVPEHERDAREKGIPMLGSGAVYRVSPDLYTCKAFEIPPHFRRICGIDFGINHPAAAAWIAYDADADVVYVYDCYAQANQTAPFHASSIRRRGDWIPVAWPHDGGQREKGGGQTLAEQYREEGVNMLPESARYDDDKGGAQPREPITMEILTRMETGRFKVFDHLHDLLAELRMIHRDNGRIVPLHDDIESAVRYAVMSLRFSDTNRSKLNRPTVAVVGSSPLEHW